MNAVGPRYFETVGISLIEGREFRDEDNPAVTEEPPAVIRPGFRPEEAPGPRVAIVNESFAARYYAGRNPIGLHVARDEKYDPAHLYEIVGVVKDAHYFGLREASEPMVYIPIWRQAATFRVLAIRTSSGTAGLVNAVRRQVMAIDPAVPVLTARTIEQQIDNNILEDRAADDALRVLRRSGAAAGRCGPVWRDLVRGHAADAGDRHPDGLRSGA